MTEGRERWQQTPSKKARAWVMFSVMCLAVLGALGTLIMCAFQAVDSYPGPRGGRRLRTARREGDAREAAA